MAKNISEKANRDRYNGNYTVGINDEGETRIFFNRNDEYVLSERFAIIYRAKTFKEAETAEKQYIYRNTAFCVIAVNYGEKLKLKLCKHVGVIYNAPIGTVGVFKRRRDAKKYMTKLRRENEEANRYVEKTA